MYKFLEKIQKINDILIVENIFFLMKFIVVPNWWLIATSFVCTIKTIICEKLGMKTRHVFITAKPFIFLNIIPLIIKFFFIIISYRKCTFMTRRNVRVIIFFLINPNLYVLIFSSNSSLKPTSFYVEQSTRFICF